jgi:hypothetical protein
MQQSLTQSPQEKLLLMMMVLMKVLLMVPLHRPRQFRQSRTR